MHRRNEQDREISGGFQESWDKSVTFYRIWYLTKKKNTIQSVKAVSRKLHSLPPTLNASSGSVCVLFPACVYVEAHSPCCCLPLTVIHIREADRWRQTVSPWPANQHRGLLLLFLKHSLHCAHPHTDGERGRELQALCTLTLSKARSENNARGFIVKDVYQNYDNKVQKKKLKSDQKNSQYITGSLRNSASISCSKFDDRLQPNHKISPPAAKYSSFYVCRGINQ